MRVEDVPRASAVVADMRKVMRQDPRIIQKLHRRVFLDKITRDEASIYVSCYVEARVPCVCRVRACVCECAA